MAQLAWKEWGMPISEYWSEAPNFDQEEGMTYPRMALLSEAHLESSRLEMFANAMAVNAAMSENPQKSIMKLLDPPKPAVTYDDVPPMLRAPKPKD